MRNDYLQRKSVIAGLCFWMAIAVGAAACGGSSGGKSKPTPTVFPTPTATGTITPTPTPTPTPTAATPTPTPLAKGGLWVPGILGPEVTMIGPTQRVTSGTPPPDFLNLSSSFNLPAALSFDTTGNMWVNNCGSGQILEFTGQQLTELDGNPFPDPNITVNEPASFGSPACPWGSEFDSLGNLWLSNRPVTTLTTNIVAYSPSQLSTGGDQTPNTIITSTAFADLRAIKFDGNGNLWMVENQKQQLLGYKAATIAASLGKSGQVNPDIVISSTSFVDPRGLAFDAIGNVWVSDASNVLLKFAASDLSSSGMRTPQVTLTSTTVTVDGGVANSLDVPEGLAFDDDNSGNLWVANIQSDNVGSIVEYTAAQLSTSGSPTPNVFLNSDIFGINFNAPGLITFGPIP